MDKHDRPYKCYEPGCDKVQGFTYSGGLSRHQREVHKNNDAKKPLRCPYVYCNRSTGNGFTREGNLREHLRRRHMHTDTGPTDMQREHDNSVSATGLKRGYDLPDNNSDDLHNEVKRLYRKAQETDRRLEKLERTIAGLQQANPQPPVPDHDTQVTQAMRTPAPQVTTPQP